MNAAQPARHTRRAALLAWVEDILDCIGRSRALRGARDEESNEARTGLPGGRGLKPGRPASAPRQDLLRLVPNALSLARLASIPAVWLALRRRHYRRAAAIHVAAVASDLTDGPLARRIGAVTSLGRVLDHLADRIYYSSLLVILFLEGTLPLWALPPVVVRDLVMVAGAGVLYRRRGARIRILLLGRIANAVLFLALLALLLRRRRLGAALYTMGASLYVASGVLYTVRAWRVWTGQE